MAQFKNYNAKQIQTLWWLNFIAATVHVGIFGYVGFSYWYVQDVSFKGDLVLQVGLQLDNQTQTGHAEFVPFNAEAGAFDVGFWIPMYILPTILSHLWQCYNVERILHTNKNNARWIEYGVTSGIMLDILAVLSGTRDIVTIVLLPCVMFTVNLTGLLAEDFRVMKKKTPIKTKHRLDLRLIGLGFFLLAVAYSGVAIAFFVSIYNNTRNFAPPWWVYLAFFGLAAIYSVFGFVFLWHYWTPDRKVWENRYYDAEIGYMVLSLTSKAFLAILVFTSLKARTT